VSALPDALVVGGGVVGASIAFHLARAGLRVALLEQGLAPGTGATARSGGLIRMHHTNPAQARLAWLSFPVFAQWPEVVGGDCGFHRTGFACVVGPEHAAALRSNVATMRAMGIAVGEVDADDFAELQPAFGREGIGAVAWEPFSGYADPARATLALLARARDAGLALHEGARVTRLLVRGGRVAGARSNLGEHAAGTTVLAAGWASAALLRPLGADLPIEARAVGICLLRSPDGEGARLCTCIDDTVGTYFRPARGHTVLVGAGVHPCAPGRRADAALGRRPLRAAREAIARRLPSLAGAPVAAARLGVDGYTPDRHALVGPVDGVEGVYLAAGFSGGGFKVAPAVGAAVARELSGGGPAPELEPFRPGRFAAGAPIRAEHPYAHM
jgi:glycine/D-amino acid oxidase-like deaminating enzyme